MGRNNLQNAPLDVLVARARAFRNAAASDPGAVGLSPEEVLSIGEGLDHLEARIDAAGEAESRYRAAVQGRMKAQADLVGLLTGAANRVYAAPAITSSAIAGLGLSPRSTSRTRVEPKTPGYVVVAMLENGEARVRWRRSGNAAEVVFMVETRVEEGPWVHAASVTRTQVKLRDVAPGVETWFRVRATKGGRVAPPSVAAVLYLSSVGRAERAA